MLQLYQHLLNQTEWCWAFRLTNHNQEEGKLCSWKQMPFVCFLCNETQSLQPLIKNIGWTSPLSKLNSGNPCFQTGCNLSVGWQAGGIPGSFMKVYTGGPVGGSMAPWYILIFTSTVCDFGFIFRGLKYQAWKSMTTGHCEASEVHWLQRDAAFPQNSFRDADPRPVIQ